MDKYGFLEIDETTDSEIRYKFTPKGHFAAHIGETHPLAFTDMVFWSNFLQDKSPKQILGILSCFTDIRLKEDLVVYSPNSSDSKINEVVKYLQSKLIEYETEEIYFQLKTGFDYKRALIFDLLDDIQEWAEIKTEEESRLFLNKLWETKEISTGDFIKSILKIVAITKEFISVCEFEGHIELMGKLQQIDSMILKYICTTQSLYV